VVKKQNQTEQKETSYTYSPSGALLEATSTSSVTDTSTSSTSSGTELVAEQSRSTVTQFSYNAAGNQTQNEQSYNSLNQLLEDRDYLYAYVPQGHFLAYAHGTREETYKKNSINRPKQEASTSLTSLTS